MEAKKKRSMEAKKKRNMEAKKKRNMEAKKKRNMETVPKKKRQNKGSVSLLRTATKITILVLRKGVRALYVHASLESAYRLVLDYVSWGILIVNSTMSATPTKTASASWTQRTASAMMVNAQPKPGSVIRNLLLKLASLQRSVVRLRNVKEKSAPVWPTHVRMNVTKEKTARQGQIWGSPTAVFIGAMILASSASARGVYAKK